MLTEKELQLMTKLKEKGVSKEEAVSVLKRARSINTPIIPKADDSRITPMSLLEKDTPVMEAFKGQVKKGFSTIKEAVVNPKDPGLDVPEVIQGGAEIGGAPVAAFMPVLEELFVEPGKNIGRAALEARIKADPKVGEGLESFRAGIQEISANLEEFGDQFPEEVQRSFKSLASVGNLVLDALGFGELRAAKVTTKLGAEVATKESIEIAAKKPTAVKPKSTTAAKLEKLALAREEIRALQQTSDVIDATNIQRIAKDAGITDLPASATGSDLTAKIEGSLAEGWFGKAYKDEAQKAISKFEEFAGDIAREGKLKESLGEEVASTFTKVKRAEDEMIKKLYKQASEVAESTGKPIKFETTKTTKLLDTLIERERQVVGIQDASKIKLLEDLKKGLSGEIEVKGLETRINPEGIIETGIPTTTKGSKIVSVEQAEATRKKIGDLAKFDKFNPTTDELNYRNLYNTLKDEIGDSIESVVPEFKTTLDAAKAKFKQVKELEKRAFVKSIQSLAKKKQFDKIISSFSSPSASVVDIRDAYAFLGKEVTENIQKTLMGDIISKAKGSGGNFTANGFSKQFKTLGDEKMKVLFTKDQIKTLKDLDTLNQALSKSQRVAQGSQTQQMQVISNTLRGVFAATTFGKSVAAEYLVSKFFRTATGKQILKSLGSSEKAKIIKLMNKVEKLENR